MKKCPQMKKVGRAIWKVIYSVEQKVNSEEGSMTIETALIIPFLIGTILLILYTALFVHDRLVLEKSAYIASLRGSQILSSNRDEIYMETSQQSKELLEGKLLLLKGVNSSTEFTKDTVEVTYETDFQIPRLGLITSWLSEISWEVEIKKTARTVNPVSFIRQYRKVIRFGKKGV